MTQNELLKKLIKKLNVESLRLPSSIEFSLTGTTLKIIISKGVTMNMQTNDSAFEGWALCLKYNLPDLIEHVEVAWDVNSVDSENLHYKRFLYRVWKFANTFPWAKCPVYDFSKYTTDGWIINYPRGASKPTAANPEAQLERKYIAEHSAEYDCICNQLPVGLFNTKISKLTRETPGQNSQIDIWAIKDSTLYVFELKVDKNRSVGIITELMFYMNVMSDLIQESIKFDNNSIGVASRHFDKIRTAITSKKIKKIEGYFLAKNLHLMITEEVIAGINSCLTNMSYSKKGI